MVTVLKQIILNIWGLKKKKVGSRNPTVPNDFFASLPTLTFFFQCLNKIHSILLVPIEGAVRALRSFGDVSILLYDILET